ncbi:MAG: hypothetical protein WC649_12260 [Desulfobacteria bacterium]
MPPGQFTLIIYAFDMFINSAHIELFHFFVHVPCGFFGEGEREDVGGGDVFRFNHVCDFGGDGRGLACACPARMSWGAGCVIDGEELAGF